MSDELVLYTNPMSRGRIARWMLEEVGAPYSTEILGYGGTMKGAAYLAINPMGKVPAIRHGDIVVTEAAAVCAYLADAFPAAKLAPDSLNDAHRFLADAERQIQQEAYGQARMNAVRAKNRASQALHAIQSAAAEQGTR